MIRQTVGPAGGVVALGPARLTIPPGALSAPVTIQAQIPAGYSGNYIQFKPEDRKSTRLNSSHEWISYAVFCLKKKKKKEKRKTIERSINAKAVDEHSTRTDMYT